MTTGISTGVSNATNRQCVVAYANRTSAGTSALVTVAAGKKIRVVAASVTVGTASAVTNLGTIDKTGTDMIICVNCPGLANVVGTATASISSTYADAIEYVATNALTFTTSAAGTGSATIWYYIEDA